MGLVIGDLKKQTNINKQVTSKACNCEETIECNGKDPMKKERVGGKGSLFCFVIKLLRSIENRTGISRKQKENKGAD